MIRFALSADFYQPLQEDELEQSTIVQIIFPAESKPVRFLFVAETSDYKQYSHILPQIVWNKSK